ncbi:YlbG family protein [Paenibacillus soyae]|uniref:YlbG family protein n=1 Tax=Paenibacillus soyae TaxID=2969249 RepID=A0A9X2MRG2_9BACL|nr:YlbG family protein [Paenibacillus soyae]MCR2804902.1 YlbG family protein [Paenibacillus soyae]
MLPDRTGFIVWVSDLKAARALERFGTVHYMSRKLHYVVMYMNADKVEESLKQMSRLSYVRKVERSYRAEIPTEYSKDSEDKTRFYSL